MTKTKELETLLLAASAALVKLRASARKDELDADEVKTLLTTSDLKAVFAWRTARRAELKDVETVPAKVVTSRTPKPKPASQPAESRTVKGAASKAMIGKTIQVRTKQFTIADVVLLDVQGTRVVVLDNRYIYPVTDIEKTPEGNSDWSIKKGVKRLRGVKLPANKTVVERESKPAREKRNAADDKIVSKAAQQAGARALAKAEKELAPKSAKEAKTTAAARRSGKDGVKSAANKAVNEEGFNSNRARNHKNTTGKKKIARG